MNKVSRFAMMTLLILVAFGSGSALFAQTARYHGADSVFRDAGLTILWAILKGKDEDSSTVYVRIVKTGSQSDQLDAFSVVARDVFSGNEKVVLRGRKLDAQTTVTESRGSFADMAQRRLLFYRGNQLSEAAVEVYYYAIPDTAPEFLSKAAVEAYLDDTLARLSGKQ